MHSTLRMFLAGLLGLSLSFAAASAASISGRVSDPTTKAALLGATLTLPELDRTAVSSAGGDYYFANIPPGTYTLEASYLGYDDASQRVIVGQNDARADFALTSDVLSLGALVVEGTREGQARALQLKRSATNIVDVVSADAVGKFPDGNAAEALRRVPGVALEIDQSEGRFVVIRGVDAALNNVTLNGLNIGSPAEQGRRGLSMDSVPADLIARLEVTKAVTPDMDHNAIGGSVNIVTQSVFDRPDGFAYGSVSRGYGDFNEEWGWWGASANYGRLLDQAGKWGVTAGVSYSFRDYASQTSDAAGWTLRNDTFVPDNQESFDYAIERSRLGANVALEHRPREGQQYYLQINYNEFIDEEERQLTDFNFGRGTLSNQTATSGSFSQGRAGKEFRDYKQKHLIDAYAVGGKHELGNDYRLEWRTGFSRGERETPRRVDWEFRSAANAFPNTYQLGGPIPVVTPTAAYYDAANYPFRRVRFRTDDEREDIYSVQADLKRDTTLLAKPGFWQTGLKYYNSDKHQDRQNTNYNLASGAANAFTLGTGDLAGPEPAGYMEGRYRIGPTINLGALQRFFSANPGRFAYDAASSLSNSLEADFDATEEVFSGYAMASLNPTPRTTLLAGLRVERTDAEYSALENRNDVYQPITESHAYTQVMPGVHFTWRPAERWAVRAAWTNTYGRASYTSLAPRNVLEDVDVGGTFEGSLSSGNPGLEPFESMNFDVSLEHYLENAGVVSIGLFHKRIDNPVYQNSFLLTDTAYRGRSYARLNVSRPDNAEKGEVTGVELNWQQFFTFLPGPFDGLGVNLNYTMVDSSATLFARPDELPFFKQSDEVGNIALVYEKYGFEGRIAYSFNSDYLESVGASVLDDGYTDRRRVLDAKLSYRINRRIQVFAEFTNLNEEPLRTYEGEPARSSGYEIYSWNANFGINWSL